MRPLAYEVKKEVGSKTSRFSDAYFGATRFTAKPAAIAAIKETLDAAEQILRFMIIIAPRENPVKIRRQPAAERDRLLGLFAAVRPPFRLFRQ